MSVDDGRLFAFPEGIKGQIHMETDARAHHADCDGWQMHSVEARRTTFGTFVPACNLCGILPVIGSAGSRETAISMAREHNHNEECDGRCLDWD